MQKHNITKLLSKDRVTIVVQDTMKRYGSNPLYEIDPTINYTRADLKKLNAEIAGIKEAQRKILSKQSNIEPKDAEVYQTYAARLEMLMNKQKVACIVNEQVEVATKYFKFSRVKKAIKNGRCVEVFKTPQELAKERDKRILALYDDYKKIDYNTNKKYNAEKEFFKAVYCVNQVYDRSIKRTILEHPEAATQTKMAAENVHQTQAGVEINQDALQSTMAGEIISASESYINSNKDVFHNDFISTEGIYLLAGKNDPQSVNNPIVAKRIAIRLVDEHKKLLDVVDNKVFCPNVRKELKEHIIDEKLIDDLNRAQNENQVKKIIIDAAKDFVETHHHSNEIKDNDDGSVSNKIVFDDPAAQERYEELCKLAEEYDMAQAGVMQQVAEHSTPEMITNIMEQVVAEKDGLENNNNELVMERKKKTNPNN